MVETLAILLGVLPEAFVLGAVWYLVAYGLMMTYWLTGTVDLMHPAYAALGAALAVAFAEMTGFNTIIVAGMALVAMAGIVVVLRVTVLAAFSRLRYFENIAARGALLLATLAVLRLVFGPGPYIVQSETMVDPVNTGLPAAGLVALIAALVLAIGSILVLRFSWLGLILKILSERPRTAAMLGFSPGLVLVCVYVAGAVIAALGGIFGVSGLSQTAQTPMVLTPGLLLTIALAPPGRFDWLFVIAFGVAVLEALVRTSMSRLDMLPALLIGTLALIVASEIARRRA